VCERSNETSDDELRKTVSDRILSDHIEAQTQEKFKEMRAAAVIERR